MPYPDVSHLPVAGAYLMLAELFLVKEVASGALKEAGKDAWVWARKERSHGNRRCRHEGR
jgi:hypothetical protein